MNKKSKLNSILSKLSELFKKHWDIVHEAKNNVISMKRGCISEDPEENELLKNWEDQYIYSWYLSDGLDDLIVHGERYIKNYNRIPKRKIKEYIKIYEKEINEALLKTDYIFSIPQNEKSE